MFSNVGVGMGRKATPVAGSTWTLTAVKWVFIPRIGTGVLMAHIFTHCFWVLSLILKMQSFSYDFRKTLYLILHTLNT